MDTFLQLNRDKLRAIFTRISLVFLAGVSIVLAIAYLTGNLPDKQLLLSIILVAGIGFPLFVISFGYLGWLLNRRTKQKVFSREPFNQIENVGFYKAYLDENSKWSLTEEIKECKINGFTLRMNLAKEKGYHFIEFDIPVEWKKLEKSEYSSLTERFKQHNAEFRIGSLVKFFDTKQQTSKTVSDIRKDLERFTALLRQEGFEPKN